MRKIYFGVLLSAVLATGAAASENFTKAEEAYKAQKFEQAYALYDRACGEGVQKACTMNAILLFNGDGVKKDRVQAEQIFVKACEANEPMACAKLAEMQAYGMTKERVKDEAKTRALFKKACDGGYQPACVWAGQK